ncbi:MAG: hypothetical protein HWN65_11480 [Candidatus Helarchaeota archaeon]|nr:hypothetical protein [Candidatus Helarchaeota archaeon]
MKNKVAVIGGALIDRFGELFDKSVDDMIEEAYLNMIKTVDKNFNESDIQAAWFGSSRAHSGVDLAHPLGLYNIPISRNTNGCATGSDAFRNACFSVAAGVYDVVLVVGVEKMKDSKGGLIARAGEVQDIWRRGRTLPAFFGLRATRHMHQFGSTREHLAMVSVKNHNNGAKYPHAHYQFPLTLEKAMKSPIVSWPLSLMDCCPITDGAAAVLICKAELARNYTDTPVYVAGSGASIYSWQLGEDKALVGFPASEMAAKAAYKMAGVEPKDIDVAEVHDCFTITELVSYEDLGFAKKGEGHKLLEEGMVMLDGSKPINPSGGLISKGHPIGASGVAQIVEIFDQLRGQAGKVQVPDVEYGLQHNIGLGRGATGSAACVHVLTRTKD